MLLKKSFDEWDGHWDVSLFGDIDLVNVSELKRELLALADGDIVLHCEHLKYIDSMGIGVLVSVLKERKDKGYHVRISGLAPHILRIFELTGLKELFEIGEEGNE